MVEEKYMRIHVRTDRATQGGDYKPGVLVSPSSTRYFHYPSGKYEQAIDALLAAGFVEGGVSPPASNFYND